MDRQNQKLKGALLTFVVLQLCYLFSFFLTFPDSFRNALEPHAHGLVTAARWLSMITMLGYCIMSLASVVQLVLRKHNFLRWFQISGAIALIGNFIVFVLRQIADSIVVDYGLFNSSDYYWTLFIMALFWTVIWCMYFARSSRLYSFMGEDSTYLRIAFFTKRVKEPIPWPDFRPFTQPPQQYTPHGYPPVQPPAPLAHQPVQTHPVQAVPYPPAAVPHTGRPVPGPVTQAPPAPMAPQHGQFQPMQPAQQPPAPPPVSGQPAPGPAQNHYQPPEG